MRALALVDAAQARQALGALIDATRALEPSLTEPLLELGAHPDERRRERGPGDEVGPYRIVEHVASDAFSDTYRALRATAPRRLVLVRGDVGLERARLERWLVATRLVGQRVDAALPVLDRAGWEEAQVFAAWDWDEGVPLVAWLAGRAPLALPAAWPLLDALLAAVATLHQQGLVHGALDGASVRVTGPTEAPRVVLHGVAGHLLREQAHPSRLALPAARAIAPEQLRGEPSDPRSDVFALGTLLWDLLAGRPAFPGECAVDVALARFATTPDPLSFSAPLGTIPDALDELALALLERDPARRPADARELRQRLERVLRASRSLVSEYPDDDLDGAIAALLAAPEDALALARLETTVTRGAPVARVADALVLAAQQLGVDPAGAYSRRRLLHHAAALLQRSAVDPQRAEETLELLVAEDPDDEASLRQLVRMLEGRGATDRAIDLLVERARRGGTPEERARALDGLARLLRDQQGDPEQALVARVRAFCETPGSRERAAAVERAAADAPAAWQEVVAGCAEALRGTLGPEARLALLYRLGRWYEVRLGRPDAAYRAYHEAVELQPAHEPTLRRMEVLLRAAEHWRELVPVLLARARVTSDATLSRALRAEAAQLAGRRVGDVAQALTLLAPLFAQAPADVQTAVLLAELRTRSGDRPGAQEVLQTALDATVGEARATVACALARLEADVGQREAAERHWREALASQPGQLEAIRALEELHFREGRFRELAEDLEAELASTVVPSARCAVLRRIARLHVDQLGDAEAASRALGELLTLDPADVRASAELGDLLTARGRWAELVELLEQRAARAAEPGARVAALAERAALLGGRLGRLAEATDGWRRVLDLDPRHRPALDALVALHLKQGEDAQALEALERLASTESEPQRRAEHRVTAASVLTRQGREVEAMALLEVALEEAPSHRGALSQLRHLVVARRQPERASALLVREIAAMPPGAERALAYLELAQLLQAVPGAGARVEAAATAAVEHDPLLAPAHALLGDQAAAAGRHAEAARHLAEALRLVGVASELHASLLTRLALSHLAAGEMTAAVTAALQLAEAHAGDPAASGVAVDILAEHGDPARAAELGRARLERFGGDLSGQERAALYLALGRAAARQGDREVAVTWLERAAAMAPRGTAALEALARVHEGRAAWRACALSLRRQLERTPAGARFEILLHLAEITARRLGDHDAATACIVEALSERPAERRALVRLAEIHGESRRWDQVVAVMVRLAESAGASALGARYLEAAARVLATELGDPARAVEAAERALDADPTLDALAEAALGWRRGLPDRLGLLRLLERRVQALAARDDRRSALPLVDELVELALAEGKAGAALTALELARSIDPVDPRWKVRLAALYALDLPRHRVAAIELQEELIADDPFAAGPHRVLASLYAAAGDDDGAWCATQALVALAQAQPDEERRFRHGQPARPPRVIEGLSRADWARHLRHPDADPALSALLAAVEPLWLERHGQALAALGYPPASRVEPEQYPGSLAAVVVRTARLLGLPPPELVHDPSRTAPLALLPSRPPAMALGAGGLEPAPLRVSEFRACEQLVGLYPGFGARLWLPSAEALKAWVLAALRLAAPRMAVPTECRGAVEEAAAELTAASAPLRGALLVPAAALLRRGESLDLTRWLRGVELTADRAGLLACDHLETALAAARTAPQGAPGVGRAERVRELFRFASSADYLALRRVLGSGVGGARATLPPPPKPGPDRG